MRRSGDAHAQSWAHMTHWSTRFAQTHQSLLVLEATSLLRHDARNRLAAIRNASFYLQRKVEANAAPLWAADARVPAFFDMIEKEVIAAEQVLAASVPETVPARPDSARLDAAALARDLLAMLAPARGVELSSAASAPVWVQVSAAELAVGFGCLLDNAVEAALAVGGGAIRIGCRVRADGLAVIEVIDRGPGFTDSPERWLKPFATSKPGHLGLGLNIARRVAARAGGSLELLAGEPGGVGARAVIALPVDPEPEGGPDVAPAAAGR